MTAENSSLEQAIAMLVADHDAVRGMFRDYKKLTDLDADGKTREALALEICNALTRHADVEEKVFYPAAREAIAEDKEDVMDHADVEHLSLKRLIGDILGTDPEDSMYDAQVLVLGEYVAHHVYEEENEMFEELRSAAPDMAQALERMKAMQAGADARLPEAPAKRAVQRQRTPRSASRKTVRSSGSSKGKAKKSA